MRATLLGTLTAALLCCGSGGTSLPEVRVHATVSPLAAEALAVLAVNRRVARVVYVPEAGGADVAWFGDPTDALSAAALLVPASAPPQPDVAERYKDPAGRFFPLCARARLLLVNPRAGLTAVPKHLKDLANPRFAGMQALVPFGQGHGPLTVAALAMVLGEDAAFEFLAGVARARPRLSRNEGQVEAAVASGVAAFGLTGSEEGAGGALGIAGLVPVYPDQDGSGTLVFPTAVAILAKGIPSAGARRLAEWMASGDAEQLLSARAPGYLPLHSGVPLPYGVRSAADIRSPRLDWTRLAEEKRLLSPRLERWPLP
jgi:iron(III) transport system substrate-binding protein